MMEGALTVSELRAHELMVPRSQIYAIDLSEPQETWLSIVNESGHSRFPAVDGDLDVKTLLRPARFIPESQPTNVLLRDFKATRSHMALVIDEFGSVSGLITIEDVLEQIVGNA